METKHILIIVIATLCLSEVVCAASLHGRIYDINLDELKNVIVDVDSIPKQRYLSKDGSYTFNLNPGEYTISATYSPDGVSIYNTTEELAIEQEGDYNYDLFILPNLDSEDVEALTDQDAILLTELDPSDTGSTDKTPVLILAAVAFIVLCVLTAMMWARHKHSKHHEKSASKNQHLTEKKEAKQDTKPAAIPVQAAKPERIREDYTEQLLEIIKKEGGRTTQKDLRKLMPLSEAKISLMVSELEHKGIVEKIKKGRGNIIILKK
jgi:uncharacterized membrane protein